MPRQGAPMRRHEAVIAHRRSAEQQEQHPLPMTPHRPPPPDPGKTGGQRVAPIRHHRICPPATPRSPRSTSVRRGGGKEGREGVEKRKPTKPPQLQARRGRLHRIRSLVKDMRSPVDVGCPSCRSRATTKLPSAKERPCRHHPRWPHGLLAGHSDGDEGEEGRSSEGLAAAASASLY